jgi:subtilisin family serine protease
MHSVLRRNAGVAFAAACIAVAVLATTAVDAYASQVGVPVTTGAVASAEATITDADAQQGAVAAIVRDVEGRPEIVEVFASTVAAAMHKAAAVRGVERVSVAAPVSVAAVTEPYRPYQWGHDALRVDSLPVTDNHGGVVAVVDTGVMASHEDFAPGQLMCLAGSNFVDDGAATACVDPHGHGTHVAGIVAASVNGKGITGVAPGTRILPVRVLGRYGSGSSHDVAEGIMWAADNGATVINASLSGPHSAAYDTAVAHATAKGVLVVAAAGNNRRTTNATGWPAASPGALSVASTREDGATSDFSHSGQTVDIAAPGSNILSLGTYDDSNYVYMSGTSMASPYVAGIASMVKTRNPSMTAGQLSDVLIGTAVDIEAEGPDHTSGAGLVNPVRLLVDVDGDGVGDDVDVCPGVADAGQVDGDGDGAGDACDDVVDVSSASPAYPYVRALIDAGVTAGCGGAGSSVRFCPAGEVTRAQMAIFLLRAAGISQDGSGLPGYAGTFSDVPDGYAARFVEELSRRGVTGGCAVADGPVRARFCPDTSAGGEAGLVTRQQMAIFLLRTAGVAPDGSSLPAFAGTFQDVPDGFSARFVEELSRRGITGGCVAAPPGGRASYCPSAKVTRSAMAIFLVRTFGLPLPS